MCGNINRNFENKTVFITGATGLIGKSLVKELQSAGANLIAVVRNQEKAEKILGSDIQYIESDIINLPVKNMSIDYIIHAAANTSSKDFVQKPVDIITENVRGTNRIFELARLNPVQGIVYLSSMEVYGIHKTDEKISEDYLSGVDTMSVRSSYPESKRLCENLCASYASQYHMPVKVVRLTQTFGAGVAYHDKRVFAEFGRCVIENKDIILKTKGETKRCYISTGDAVSAILTVLIKGNAGEAYNVANEDTYCTIYEMACLVATQCAKGRISVKIMEEDIREYGYAPTLNMNLDTSKLRKLGWNPKMGLEDIFHEMIEGMKTEKCSQ